MAVRLIDIAGVLGAALTTLCWLPQAIKVMREKETRALSLSLPATAAFTCGVVLWLVYGGDMEPEAVDGGLRVRLNTILHRHSRELSCPLCRPTCCRSPCWSAPTSS